MDFSKRNIASKIFKKPSLILKEINSNAVMTEWLSNNPAPELFDSREEMYEYVNNSVCNNNSIDYLEFGV